MTKKWKTALLGTLFITPMVLTSVCVAVIITKSLQKPTTEKIIVEKESDNKVKDKTYYQNALNMIKEQILNKNANHPIKDFDTLKYINHFSNLNDVELILKELEYYKDIKNSNPNFDKAISDLDLWLTTNNLYNESFEIEITNFKTNQKQLIDLKEIFNDLLEYNKLFKNNILNFTLNTNTFNNLKMVLEKEFNLLNDIKHIIVLVHKELFKITDTETNNVSYNQEQVNKLWNRYLENKQEINNSNDAKSTFINEVIKAYSKMIKGATNEKDQE